MLKFLRTDIKDFCIPEEHPAFVQFMDRPNIIQISDDCILQIDNENLFVNIIKTKKGGKTNMTTKIVRVAKPRMEEYFEEFKNRKEKLEEKKVLAIEEAVKKVTEEVELEFAQEAETLDKLINDVSEEKEIEVEEEPVETVPTEEVIESEEPVEGNTVSDIPVEQPVNQVF